MSRCWRWRGVEGVIETGLGFQASLRDAMGIVGGNYSWVITARLPSDGRNATRDTVGANERPVGAPTYRRGKGLTSECRIFLLNYGTARGSGQSQAINSTAWWEIPWSNVASFIPLLAANSAR